MHGQKEAFQARLQRIGASQPVTVSGPATTRESVGNLLHVLSYPGAFLLGIVSILLSRYVMYHMGGIPDPSQPADIREIIDVTVGGVVLIAFALAFNLKTKEHVAAKFAGLWAAQLTLHNFVHTYPEIWSSVFAPEWVRWVTEITEPNSIVFQGMNIALN